MCVVVLLWDLRRATIMQMQTSSMGQADTGSVALPAVLRAGESGQGQFSMGSIQSAKFSTTSNQAHTGHMPPSTVGNRTIFIGWAEVLGFTWVPLGHPL